MNELNNFDLLSQLVSDRQAELRREAEESFGARSQNSAVRQVLLMVLGSAALLALLVALGIVLA